MPDLDPTLDLLVRLVPDAAAVYLFGSHAAGTATAGRDVDLVDLRSASTVMQARVVSTGRVVRDAEPGERARFEVFVCSSYAMLNEERAGILADIAARGMVHG